MFDVQRARIVNRFYELSLFCHYFLLDDKDCRFSMIMKLSRGQEIQSFLIAQIKAGAVDCGKFSVGQKHVTVTEAIS